MGKGTRKRKNQAIATEACTKLRREARNFEKYMRILCIVAVVLLAISMFFQGLALWTLHSNKEDAIANNFEGHYLSHNYTQETVNELNRLLPFGLTGVSLMTLGAVAATILLFKRKNRPALIPLAAMLVGIGFFLAFLIPLAELLPYTDNGVRQQGLDFGTLFWRHYTAFLPPVLLLVAAALGWNAQKKRDLADVMENANDTSSTIMLDEAE